MIQGRLFICEEPPTDSVEMYRCPICKFFTLLSTDPLNNDYVALGDVVCSEKCYVEAYNGERERQHEIPFYHQPP